MPKSHVPLKIYFSDFFEVSPQLLSDYGAFNISLITDLPLFIDPFLLFNSDDEQYQRLHAQIIDYVVFLKNESKRPLPEGRVKTLFYFPEVRQNWLGYSKVGNAGRGLGGKFAASLKKNLTTVFAQFGEERGTSSHIEKLTLIKSGVGRDQVSDFTCNLIKGFLCRYTEEFARQHIDRKYLQKFMVRKVSFNHATSTWAAREFVLPKFQGDFVLLSPNNMLTKDSNWINQRDLVADFSAVVESVDNSTLRAEIDRYFVSMLPVEPTRDDIAAAVEKAVKKYPGLLDDFIALKELDRTEATNSSAQRVAEAHKLFVSHLRSFCGLLLETDFYQAPTNSLDEALRRIGFLKHVIEKEDGYRLFYIDGKPLRRESDLQIMFKLTWFASAYDSNAEVNNGRGPADSVVSYGSKDKVAIEFKLGSNAKLEDNLLEQAEIYSDAARATHAPIKVILCLTESDWDRVKRLLKAHKLDKSRNVVVIDGLPKESASKVKTK